MKEIKRILILDDDEKVRFNLQLFLEDEGFNCFGAETAELAEKLLDEIDGTVDVAIVDIRLPGKSGEEFIPIMKNKYPGIKVIIHTGSTDYRVPNQFMKFAITNEEVFHKPIKDLNDLVQKVNLLLLNQEII
jgi:two-component system, OmpR family, response regulator